MRVSVLTARMAVLVATLLAIADPVSAFGTDTHRRLNEQAGSVSKLGEYLPEELSLSLGLKQPLAGKNVGQWIERGGVAEDEFLGSDKIGAFFRSRHHFHDPLRPWSEAGLDALSLCPPFLLRGQASVRWAQNPAQGVSGQASWLDARRRFIEALTLATSGEREVALARTFQILGQQAHLVADLAVPAHVRNDPHCPAPEGFERWASRNSALIDSLAAMPQRPDPGIFSVGVPLADDVARVPVARLWDTERYRLIQDPEVTLGGPIGLAEYTNANFLSDDTIFGRPPFPAPGSVDLGPPEPEPLTGELRRYFRKVRDGEPIDHLAVPSALFDALPAALKDRRMGLDDNVFRDYAARLIPRAVGYSAALLDYFFRGRLDVDLADDGSGLRLVGANGSAEPLDGGTLTVYADGADGVRRPAGTGTGVGRVEPDATLPPVAVAPPEGAERFVAVYTGALGEERPAGAFPGGVIGKVLGGYRVEQLFSDGTRWNLRTPKGIFPLPILRSDIADLRWGDADNTLVGRTAFGTGQPNTLRAYRLNRPPGSTDVPLRAAAGGGQEVDVQQTAAAAFPVGLDVGGLQLSSTIDYQQYLISFVHTTVVDNGELVSDTYGDGKAERAVSGAASATFTWRLTLDLAKFNTFRARPYLWQLQQIGLTTDGRLVALVRISLTQLDPSLPESFAVFPSKQLVWCGQSRCSSPPAVQDGPPAKVVYGFGRGAQNHWALVDVSQGRVVYATAADGVVINNVIQATQFREFVSGPFQGLVATEIRLRIVDGDSFYTVDSQNNLRFGNSCNPPADSGHYEVSRVELPFGVPAASVSQYRPELTRTEFPPFSEHLRFEEKACLAAISGLSPYALVVVASDEARVYLNDTLGAFRVPDGSERVALLLDLGQGLATNFRGGYARVVAWDPLAQSASLRHEILTGDVRQLITAAHGVAVTSGINSPALTAVPLEGNQPATVFPMTLGEVFNFRALSPAFLYSIQDLKFYRYRPDLLKTALPAALATGGSATGDYHAIRLR